MSFLESFADGSSRDIQIGVIGAISARTPPLATAVPPGPNLRAGGSETEADDNADRPERRRRPPHCQYERSSAITPYPPGLIRHLR